MSTPNAARYYWLVVNDLTPNRATVVAVYTDGTQIDAQMERVGGYTHALVARFTATPPAIGSRIWL